MCWTNIRIFDESHKPTLHIERARLICCISIVSEVSTKWFLNMAKFTIAAREDLGFCEVDHDGQRKSIYVFIS